MAIGLRIRLRPWGRFRAVKDDARIKAWLQNLARQTEAHFKGSMGKYPPSSAPGAFPNVRSGNLRGSIKSIVTADSMEIGTNMFYSTFLKYGTRKMAKRKMSREAFRETYPKAIGTLRGFARWRRG